MSVCNADDAWDACSDEEKFVLLQAEKNHGVCVYWDWEEEAKFANFLGDKDAEALFDSIIDSDAPHPVRVSAYKNCKETKRITRKRSNIIKNLTFWFDCVWSGTGYGGYSYTGAKRFKTFLIKDKYKDFLKNKGK